MYKVYVTCAQRRSTSVLHWDVLIVIDNHTISDAAAMILTRLFRRPKEPNL
jgi:hypothetical protein